MLARTLGPKFSHFPCWIQPKLNGVRCLYQAGVFQSRDEKIFHPEVLQHIHDELNALRDMLGPNILDGELYVHGWKLQRINAAIAVNRQSPTEDSGMVQYHIFDTVSTDLFSKRRPLIPDTQYVRYVPTFLAEDRTQIERCFRACITYGYEGVILRPDGPYEPDKRSHYLWKYKEWETGDFLCDGWTRGEGKAAIGVGALTLRTEEGKQFEVGTGFTDEERVQYANDSILSCTIRIRYAPCLTDDGIPTHASFLAIL